MPPPPPSEEACIRAAELYAQGYPWRHVAELLRAERYKCNSHETARRWAEIGTQLQRFAGGFNKERERWRTADGLDQDMAALREMVRTGQASALEIMPQLKWLYRERAKLLGTDAPSHLLLSDERGGSAPDPEVAAQLRAAAAQADADIAALRNGQP